MKRALTRIQFRWYLHHELLASTNVVNTFLLLELCSLLYLAGADSYTREWASLLQTPFLTSLCKSPPSCLSCWTSKPCFWVGPTTNACRDGFNVIHSVIIVFNQGHVGTTPLFYRVILATSFECTWKAHWDPPVALQTPMPGGCHQSGFFSLCSPFPCNVQALDTCFYRKHGEVLT